MSYFQRHVFVCTNERNDPCRQSCGDHQAGAEALEYLKARSKDLGLAGPGQLRVSKAGCLGRCEEGPLLVIYPEARWYTYVDETDLAEIVEQDLRHGQVVERLLLDR